jgi:hypothetical protein
MPLNPLRPNYRPDSEFVPSQIVSANGLLSPKQSNAIMERLKRPVGPTDILERCTVVVESVVESPLTNGKQSQQDHLYRVCGRYHFCGAFYSSVEISFRKGAL